MPRSGRHGLSLLPHREKEAVPLRRHRRPPSRISSPTKESESKEELEPNVLVASSRISSFVADEIAVYQDTTTPLILPVAFRRVSQDILHEMKHNLNFSRTATMALQEASEAYMAELFKKSELCREHRKRKTLEVSDMQLACLLSAFPVGADHHHHHHPKTRKT